MADPEDHWVDWHRGYDIEGSSLQRRLAVVRRCIRESLDQCAPGPIRVVSMCAGQGHDLIGALADHPRAADVRARLVELHPDNCAEARASAPAGVEVVCADAATTTAYAGAVPAEVVLANGVFGNISDADIVRTIEILPSLCAPGATVIWTRHRREPDLTGAIREWFLAAGFAEVAFEGPVGFIFGVGVNRLAVPPTPFVTGVKMFEFVGSDQNWPPSTEPA
jgi:hypothetical protein